MQAINYIDDLTQAIDIDFTILMSGSEYVFVNCNILFEFSRNGLVTDTRMDVHPLKYSTLSHHSADPSELSTEVFRMIFFLYTSLTTLYGLATTPREEFFTEGAHLGESGIAIKRWHSSQHCFCRRNGSWGSGKNSIDEAVNCCGDIFGDMSDKTHVSSVCG